MSTPDQRKDFWQAFAYAAISLAAMGLLLYLAYFYGAP